MLLALLLACSSSPVAGTPAAETPVAETPSVATAAAPVAAAPSADGVALGADFTATEVVPVDQLVSAAATWNGKAVVVEGVVKEVCQKKGCWHTIATADPAVAIMVKDAEYKIFLPKDAAGKKVHVKGTFAQTSIPEDEARHYAEDAGRDPSTIVGPQPTFAIDVDGVKFL